MVAEGGFADSNKKKLLRRVKEGKNLRTQIRFTNTRGVNIKLKISGYEKRLTQEGNIFYTHLIIRRLLRILKEK